MGRNKIDIEYIQDPRKRQVTFGKRHKGLMKKAYELGVLTKADVAVIIINSKGEVFQYSSSDIPAILSKYTAQIEKDSLRVSHTPDSFKYPSDQYRTLPHEPDGIDHLRSHGLIADEDAPPYKKHSPANHLEVPHIPDVMTHSFSDTHNDPTVDLPQGLSIPTVSSRSMGIHYFDHSAPSVLDQYPMSIESHIESTLDVLDHPPGSGRSSETDDLTNHHSSLPFFTDSMVHK
ncbi:hypothetical protein ADUPG1_012764 [Aduncisulcus paluster]|uniref:MADS-box domain-containing protein n=1 Tax=Aduncisulcus paluster TaxID=2918883 RepID=A0ABQ5K0K6_9EUKA|nr:hypothetical protein ADUPG1_012764 [Aduncisulcus paluster]|eukprot:gnl/Carplike_NY0171/669_a927_2348.p1 GENE.gnl/Carplike_NY0171/669_a927_2348~~gnl/Carplike_NY0171/669_a927_2348.p1  ORF type:complete len:232 (+),score=31.94 gnl/Carplike_NY0171/669_a927_2348:327-1022(+)